MPRIRSLKPELWTDPKLVGCSAYARLLYLGLFAAADDHGVAGDDPARLKLQILPADAVDVAGLLDELVAAGKLQRALTPAGAPVLVLVDWHDEQRIDKPSAPRHAPRDQLTPAGPREPSRALASSPEPSPDLALEGREGREGKRAASQLGRGAARPDHEPDHHDGDGEVRDAAVVLQLHPPPTAPQQDADPPGDGTEGAQEMVGWWIAAHLQHGQHRPPKRVVGHVAREVRQLLAEHVPADAIRIGLDTLRAGGLHPSALASLVNQHRNHGTGWTATRTTTAGNGGGDAGYVRADLAALNAAIATRDHPGDTAGDGGQVREVQL